MKVVLNLALVATAFAVVYGQKLAKQVCSADNSFADFNYDSANVILGGSLAIRNSGSDGLGCGPISTGRMQYLESARFALNYLNNYNGGQGYLPGVTFGMRMTDNCFSHSKVLNGIQKLFPKTTTYQPYCSDTSPKVMLGMVGPYFSGTGQVAAEYAPEVPVSVISIAMSTKLSDSSKYPSFFRIVSSTAVQMRSLAAVLDKLQMKKVLIIHADEAFSYNSYEQLVKASQEFDICISQAIKVPASASVAEYKAILEKIDTNTYVAGVITALDGPVRKILEAIQQIPKLQQIQWIGNDFALNNPISSTTLKQARGFMVTLPKTNHMDTFQDYFVGLLENPLAVVDNPWFKEWYEKTYGCTVVSGNTNQCVKPKATLMNSFEQNPYVVPIIKAVFAYAKVFEGFCPSGTGVCQNALQATPEQVRNALKNLDYTFTGNIFDPSLAGEKISFDANGDIADSAFSIFQYNDNSGAFSFQELGVYRNGQLTMSQNPKFYDASRDNALPTAPVDLCGSGGCQKCILPPNQVQYHYTPGDVVIASLINAHMHSDSLFTCGPDMEKGLASIVAAQWAVGEYKRKNANKLRGVSLGSLVADICPTGAVASGFLSDLFSSSSRVMDSSGIAISSRQNIYGFVDYTGNMMAEVISPMLSQLKLPEIRVEATGMNVKPGDKYPHFSSAVPNEQLYLKALTSLLLAKRWTYVQTLTEKNQKYLQKAKAFKEYAASHGICVVSTSYLDDGASSVLGQLLSDSNANVVVTFGYASHIKDVFDKTKGTGNSGKLLFISGMAEWGTDPRYFDIATSDPEYTITLGLRQEKNIDFENYLKGLTRTEIIANPFLTDLFEVANKCSLLSSTRAMYQRVCSPTDVLSPYQGNAPYLIQAVYNMADKLHDIIADVCQNPNYNGLCVAFRSTPDIPQRLGRELKNSDGIANGEGTADIMYYVVKNGVYVQSGYFDTKELHLSSAPNSVHFDNKFDRATTCPGVCLECHYLYSYKNIAYKTGDFYIAGSFGVSGAGPVALQPYVCGELNTKHGPLFTTAMMYALDQVNQKKAPVEVKGLTIGGLILDHCHNAGREKLIVSDIYSGFLHQSMNIDKSKILSWVTDNTGSTQETADLLDPLGIAIVSPSASSESLLTDYDSVFRTIQGDLTTASAVVKMAKHLGFPYIQVVYGAGSFARNYKDTLATAAESEGVCVTAVLEFSDVSLADSTVQKLMSKETNVVVLIMGASETLKIFEAISFDADALKSLVIITPEALPDIVSNEASRMVYPPLSLRLQTSDLSDYKAYLDKSPVNNIFFAHYYMKMFQCNLEGYYLYNTKCSYPLKEITKNNRFDDSSYTLSTINAVYSIIDALDLTIKDYCGADYTAPCISFLKAPDQHQRLIKHLSSVRFIDEGGNDFRFLQREGNGGFDVLQFSNSQFKQIEVGSYAGVTLNLGRSFNNAYKDVVSRCNVPCLECINKGLNFSLTLGDIYLGGLFDVHQSSFDPFSCGRIKTLHGFLLLEAFHYALEQVNSRKDILNGVKLGGVGLDACSSQVRGGQLISNINNNLTPLTKYNEIVDASTIDAYIGTYDSPSSRYLARILNDLKIPQISYAASSSDLSDQRLYPYFYRTVPSNAKQVDAILAYLNEKDIRYIQILYLGNSDGKNARDELTEKAAMYKICVAQTVEYADFGIAVSERSKAALATLLNKPAANTVVTFVGTSYINSVLRAIRASDRAHNKLRFVGSDVWADNKEAIRQAEEYALDSITLQLDSEDVEEFESYINSKTLANSDGNPWFEEYYQEIHNCYTSLGNPYGYTQACPESISSIISNVRYQQDPNVVYVINAVYAAAFSIHETLIDLCGKDYQTVCQAYRKNLDRRDAIRDNLQDVHFTDKSDSMFKFTKDKDAEINYRFNAIVPGPLGEPIYRKIGIYNSSSRSLQMIDSYQPTHPWNSDCDREEACEECPAIRDSSTRYAFYQSPNAQNNDGAVIVAFFDIHKQGVDPYRCGELNMVGFQQFLAFFYGMDQLFVQHVQGNSVLLGQRKGFTILAVDTCSNPVRLDQDLFGLLQGTGLCNIDNFQIPTGLTLNADNIGVVVASGEMNTMAAGRLLEQLHISYISPNAKSPLLDDNMYLMRTVAPISAQMRFLSQLIMYLGWDYMDVIYEEEWMGYYQWQRFHRIAVRDGHCLASPFAVTDGTTGQDIENLMGNLHKKKGSNVVVLLGGRNFFERAMDAANKIGIVEDYVWIMAGDEELDDKFIKSISPTSAVKILSFHRLSVDVLKFDDYVKQMICQSQNKLVPQAWFEEFVQAIKVNADNPINVGSAGCFNSFEFEQDEYVLNTIAAAYAAAKGLREFMNTGKQLESSRIDIKKKILEAELALDSEGITSVGLKFMFDYFERWWDPGHVVNYWLGGNKQESKIFKELPTHDSVSNLKRDLNMTSMCLETESQGFCGCDVDIESVFAEAFAHDPSSHRNYYKYYDDGEQVHDWPVWAIVVAVLTSAGLLITIVSFLILLCAYPKRGGTSVLGYMMIVGIILIYAINFAFFIHATEATCGIRRFLMSVVYTICFAPLLIKAIDNWRFGHVDYAERRYSGISSSCVLLMSAIGVVLIQCIIPIMWLILVHPDATDLSYGDNRHDNSWCTPTDDYDLGLVLSFAFVLFLLLITGIFSALSYGSETNNYESRWILFACIATAGCFLVWMIVTTNAKAVYRDPAVAIANFTNATILLMIIPLRKMGLMIQAKRHKDDKGPVPMNGDGHFDMYSESYMNPGYELSDYNEEYNKPSEF